MNSDPAMPWAPAEIAAVRARVVAHRRLNPQGGERDLRQLLLQPIDERFAYREGQFVGLEFPAAPGAGVAYFSIASARDGETRGRHDLSLLLKHADDDAGEQAHLRSGLLATLDRGDELLLRGPYGECFLPEGGHAPMLMVATGTGVAPMRAALQRLARVPRSGKRLLFYGARAPEEAAFVDELARLPPTVAEVRFAWSRRAGALSRYVHHEMLEARIPVASLLREAELSLCVCGLPAMERAVAATLAELCGQAGLDWLAIRSRLQRRGALHVQTY